MHDLYPQVTELLRSTARECILPAYRALADHHVEMKEPGEVVTSVDRESERRLSDGLSRICTGAKIVGEEACSSDARIINHLTAPEVWIVDPIDGTANFVAGHAPFGIIIALARDGVSEAGWLYDPLADRTCHAVREAGAWIDGRPLRIDRQAHARPIAALATQFMEGGAREALRARAQDAFDLVPIPRCAAEHYPRLASGENDVALFQRSLPWDHAAGALLLQEAGGHVARWDGSPYCFHDGKAGLLAARDEALWHRAAEVLLGDDRTPPPLRPQQLDIILAPQ